MSPCMERRPSEATLLMLATPPSMLWPPTSPECPARITPSLPRFPSLASLVTVRWTEVTTPTPRLSARLSTSAQPMVLEVSPSTASSAPTEPSSTRTTSSATGGSTLTAPPLPTSTASMMSMLPRETLSPDPLAMPCLTTLLPSPLMTAMPPPPPPSTLLRLLDVALDVRDPQAAPAGEEDSKLILQRQVTASTNISRLCISSQCNVPIVPLFASPSYFNFLAVSYLLVVFNIYLNYYHQYNSRDTKI